MPAFDIQSNKSGARKPRNANLPINAQHLKQTQLREALSSELRGESRALFEALDNRRAAFKAAVDSLRPRVPEPLPDLYEQWFNNFNDEYALNCDVGAQNGWVRCRA